MRRGRPRRPRPEPGTDAWWISIYERARWVAGRIGFRDQAGEDVAGEVVCRFAEGRGRHQTVDQAVIDVVRELHGRKGSPGYVARQALKNAGPIEEYRGVFDPGALHGALEHGERAQLILRCVEGRDRFIVEQILEGRKQEEIGVDLGVTGSRVSQLLKEMGPKIRKKARQGMAESEVELIVRNDDLCANSACGRRAYPRRRHCSKACQEGRGPKPVQRLELAQREEVRPPVAVPAPAPVEPDPRVPEEQMESTQKFMNPRFSVSGSELAELLDIPATEVRRLGAEGIFDTYKVHDRLTKYDPDQAKAALEAHRAELLGEDEETADDDQDELVEEAEDLEESADQVDGDDEDLEEEAPAPARKVAKAPRKAPAARIPRRAPGRPAKKGSAKRKAAGLGGFPVWRVAAVAGGSAMVGSALGRALAHALLGL